MRDINRDGEASGRDWVAREGWEVDAWSWELRGIWRAGEVLLRDVLQCAALGSLVAKPDRDGILEKEKLDFHFWEID